MPCSHVCLAYWLSYSFRTYFSAHLFCAPTPTVYLGVHSICSRVPFLLHIFLGQFFHILLGVFFPPTSFSVPQLCVFRVSFIVSVAGLVSPLLLLFFWGSDGFYLHSLVVGVFTLVHS